MTSVQLLNYHRQILHGDVMDRLKEIPNGTFDCIITSPPYWALRDYSIEGQWGLEPTFQEYLEKMKKLMNELKRVLKNTGSCWINIGDTYNNTKVGNTNGIGSNSLQVNSELNNQKIEKHADKNIQIKSRVGIPERFYINCIDSGWIARNNIPWVKANAMPSSVKDRFTPKWEPVYFFVKNKKYYFNLDAVRVKVQDDKKNHGYRVPDKNAPIQQGLLGGDVKNTEPISTNKQDETLGADGKPKATYKGFNERWKNRKYQEQTISRINSGNYSMETGESLNHPNGKNPGDVIFFKYSDDEIFEWIKLCRENTIAWDMAPNDLFYINPKPTKENHKATFPVELPQHILKCSCPKSVCVKCGQPKFPISKPTKAYQDYLDSIKYADTRSLEVGLQDFMKNLPRCNSQYETVGYDTCDCNGEFIPGIVLDPFFGSGTTGIAAEIEGVRWCGIELKEEYSEIAKRRLSKYVTQGSLVEDLN